MKRICVVVLMVALLSVVSPAFALIQAFRLGAVGQDTLAGTVSAGASIITTDYYKTFESPYGTDYQVTAGHTLYITKIVWACDTAGRQIRNLGYADNGVGEQAAAPTNTVEVIQSLFGDARITYSLEGLWKIPAGKYPYMNAYSANVMMMIFGIEVAN